MNKRINTLFYLFLSIHLIAWTLAPALIRFTLPMDAMEGATWGHQLEWGYDKNPFMNAWLTTFAVSVGGESGWLVYLFSQLSVVICFWCVFILGKKILTPVYALCGVLLLEAIQYYNLHAIDFNDNTLELGFWALTILFFYQALRTRNYTNWILTGLCAGLSMMVKYYSFVLLFPMLLLLIFQKNYRQNFKKLSFYLGVLTFVLVITPHFIWLLDNDFITVKYALNRVDAPSAWWVHLFYPAQFAWQMFEAILPAIILFLILVGAQVWQKFFFRRVKTPPILKPKHVPYCIEQSNNSEQAKHIFESWSELEREEEILIHKSVETAALQDTTLRHAIRHHIPLKNPNAIAASSDDKKFLYVMAFAPFLLTLLLSAVFGMKLRAGWGQPLFSLWGLAFLAMVQPVISVKRFYTFVGLIFLLLALLVTGYSYALIQAKEPSSANFPGKNIALLLTSTWENQFHQPLQYVAGTRNLAGNIAYFSPDHPAVYIDWNNNVSAWIDENQLKRAGAIFVWDLSNDVVSYAQVKERFANLGELQTFKFAWMRNKEMAPVEIQVAFLAPEV